MLGDGDPPTGVDASTVTLSEFVQLCLHPGLLNELEESKSVSYNVNPLDVSVCISATGPLGGLGHQAESVTAGCTTTIKHNASKYHLNIETHTI